MFRPQMALALGTLLLALGFAVGVEPTSTSVSGVSYRCGAIIEPGWLAPGTPSAPVAEVAATRDERRLAERAESQCRPTMTRAAWLTWGTLALGAAAMLVGWTTLREREHPVSARAGDLPSLWGGCTSDR